MTDNNGQVARRMISPMLLTARDHLRAKAPLADIVAACGYDSTYAMVEDAEWAVPFTIWCLKTRTDPGFTWDQALDTPYLLETEIGESGPPQTPAPPTGGASDDTPESRRKPNASTPEPAAAPSSG